MMFELSDIPDFTKVIGIGGAGVNAIKGMTTQNKKGLSFHAIDTDQDALAGLGAGIETLFIGERVTGGKGAKSSPEMGEKAALESASEIAELIDGADLVLLIVGSGGGTGQGAAPVIANILNGLSAFTVVITSHSLNADGEWIGSLKSNTESLITVSNDNLLVKKSSSISGGYSAVNKKMANIVKALTGLIYEPQFIGVALSDLFDGLKNTGISKYVMANGGMGKDKILLAIKRAMDGMLEDDVDAGSCTSIVIVMDNSAWVSVDEFHYILEEFERFFPSQSQLLLAGVLRTNHPDDFTLSVICS